MSTPATLNKPKAPSTVNDEGDDVSSSDFPSPSRIDEYTIAQSAKKGKAATTRDSLSSVSTSNEYNESSGYSTPATSAAATPASFAKPATSTARRGRRITTMTAPLPAVNAVARAAALRNSQYSLNPNKRKRIADSEDDEDLDDDNTADAQLARALQEQEDAAANSMSAMALDGPAPRRTPRNAPKILPKTDYVSSDDEPMIARFSSPNLAKRPKVELSSKGTNSVKFSGSKKANIVQDTDDESDDFIEVDDSEDSDVPLSMTTPRSSRMKKVVEEQSKYFKTSASRHTIKMAPSTSRTRAIKPSASAFSAKSFAKPSTLKREDTKTSASSALLTTESEFDSQAEESSFDEADSDSDVIVPAATAPTSARRGPRSGRDARRRVNLAEEAADGGRRARMERARLEAHHPELHTMWKDLENLPKIGSVNMEQPKNINRELKPFQLQGVAWMKAMEQTEWGGGLLGDEMGMGKTIQAVSLIMSDFPAAQPSLVLIPPVALMQWQQEIASYTDGTLKTFVYHGTNAHTKGATVKDLKKYDVILMSYNSLESMYRKQEKGFKRKNGIHKEKSIIHQIQFHRVILDEAHNIKVSLPPSDLQVMSNKVTATYHWFCKSLLCFESRS